MLATQMKATAAADCACGLTSNLLKLIATITEFLICSDLPHGGLGKRGPVSDVKVQSQLG
jgi:hypothetical protein